jgi:putative colanic acid biosynthesis acetyltransferase WcaF
MSKAQETTSSPKRSHQKQTDLSQFENAWFDPGASFFKRAVWFLVNAALVKNPLNPFIKLKIILLRWFGADIGQQVIIKPGVNVKYPWNLEVGDHTWIGENVWIDNLVKVKLGSHVCVSQGAYLLTGNHNYKKSSFDLLVEPITVEQGAWIGANTTVTPGVTARDHAILAAGSVATQDLEPYTIYQGNPAQAVRQRNIQ